MCGTQVYYINCFKDGIKSFLIDNINNRPLGVILLGVSGLFIILSDYNVDGKTTTRVFITGVINENNGLMDEFSVLDCNYVSG